MAKSDLLKEAIADAKAVRETAIANAKVALEEAFTPRLQSVLSKKIQQEIDGEEEEVELEEEYGAEDAPTGDSSSIGAGASADSGTNNKQPSGITTDAHTELDPETDKISDKVGTEDDNVEVVKEEEQQDDDGDGVIDDPTGAIYNESDDFDADDEFGDEEGEEDDELDLESIIRELEDEFGDEEEGEEEFEAEPEIEAEPEVEAEPEMESEEEFGDEEGEEFEMGAEEDEDDVDLDEILREMGYGDDEEEAGEEDLVAQIADKEEELEEAYKVIRSLKGTINEVNLLNSKLLYSNKLFTAFEMTNEQKMRVVETLDRTKSVREVKLVFATLAESLKFASNKKRSKKSNITEGLASKPVASTAPKKEIIQESNELAERFKKLAFGKRS